MMLNGFYYFLVVGELAILGLIIAGIYLKVKRVWSMSAGGTDDQNSEHYVSKYDQFARPGSDIMVGGTTGLRSQAGEVRSGHSFPALNS